MAKQIEFQTSKVTEATVLEKKKDTVVILTESQAVTEEGEVELVTFIQPQTAATPRPNRPRPLSSQVAPRPTPGRKLRPRRRKKRQARR